MRTARSARPLRYRLLARRFLCVSALSAALFWLRLVPHISAASAGPLEYDVKAAFLLNFTKFIEWPPGAFATADAPLIICIVGDDPFGRAIDQIVEGESVNGHRIVIERVGTYQQKSCRVLYAGGKTPPPGTPGLPVLTVGEGDDFIHQGGMIGFVLDNRRVRFDINLKAAANAGLKLSSKLLSVARSVEK